jgi:hypothetical protein
LFADCTSLQHSTCGKVDLLWVLPLLLLLLLQLPADRRASWFVHGLAQVLFQLVATTAVAMQHAQPCCCDSQQLQHHLQPQHLARGAAAVFTPHRQQKRRRTQVTLAAAAQDSGSSSSSSSSGIERRRLGRTELMVPSICFGESSWRVPQLGHLSHAQQQQWQSINSHTAVHVECSVAMVAL